MMILWVVVGFFIGVGFMMAVNLDWILEKLIRVMSSPEEQKHHDERGTESLQKIEHSPQSDSGPPNSSTSVGQ